MAYRRGRDWEYRAARKLRDEGYFVIRAAGSKPIDLIAIKDGQVMLVECKTKKPSPSGVEELRRLGRELGIRIALAVKGEPLKIIYEPNSESPSTTEAQGGSASPEGFETRGDFASLDKIEAPKFSANPHEREIHVQNASLKAFETPGLIASHSCIEASPASASPYKLGAPRGNASLFKREAPERCASPFKAEALSENASPKTYEDHSYIASQRQPEPPAGSASPMALEAHLQSADKKSPLLFKFRLRGSVE